MRDPAGERWRKEPSHMQRSRKREEALEKARNWSSPSGSPTAVAIHVYTRSLAWEVRGRRTRVSHSPLSWASVRVREEERRRNMRQSKRRRS
jgi:hypothetical protein